MIGVNVIAADTDEAACRLFTSLQMQFVAIGRGQITQIRPPVESTEGLWKEAEQRRLDRALHYSVVGSAETVKRGLEAILEETRADELMLTAQLYDLSARLCSFEVVAGVREAIISNPPNA
jgi:alkanesulfonate monooxygenase SsuD/methylene tetrahydromethanopterin reductase-like flavin-dependent oxidoreductase (luciferase family)